MRGIVVKFSDFKGYGFIRSPDGIEYFVHVSQVGGDGFKTLTSGQTVEFEPYNTIRGWQARDVHIVRRDQPNFAPSEPERLRLKRNPFSPQDPVVDPNKFAGRQSPFRNAVDALFNNKNVLITGPRGIGKSSMAYQLLYLTQGQKILLNRLGIDLGDYEFDYITGDYRCVPGNSLLDIAAGLVSTLRHKIASHERVLESKVDLDVDLKLLKASADSTTASVTPSELSTLFVSEVEQLYRQVRHLTKGISFLIDEVDVLEDKVELAPFLKATIEKFRLDGLPSISFIVSGVTGTTTSLIAQHPSSTRLFEMLELQRMLDEELAELIEVSLEGTGVGITMPAKLRILALSNRFPQPVHLLGYHSFRLDNDDEIQELDVESAVEFVVQTLKRQEFNDKLEHLGRGVVKDILKVLAVAKLETVNVSYVVNRLPDWSPSEVVGSFAPLEQWGILEKQHRGVYRFREPLFKIYLRWVFGLD